MEVMEQSVIVSTMKFTEIPEEVIFDHIFPYLDLNDFLRLRRVSKLIKPLAEDYLRLHVTSEAVFCIKPDKNLSALLDLDFLIPYTRFEILNDEDNKTWADDRIQKFVEVYGNKITHLEISYLEIPIMSQEAIRFFESLPNLKHLEIQDVYQRGFYSKKKRGKAIRASNANKELSNLIPSTFKRLKTLRLFEYNCVQTVESNGLIWKFVEACSPQLQFLRHPDHDWDSNFDLGSLTGGRFGSVIRMLEGGTAPHLEFYDIRDSLENGKMDTPPIARDFYHLVTACSKSEVKLLNVDAEMIEGMMRLETWDMEEHGKKISKVVASLHFLHTSCFLLELPHLEKIVIGNLEGVWANCSMPHWEFERQAWLNLKELVIKVDSDYLWESYDESVETVNLLEYFFVGIRREKMEYLNLNFYPRYLRDNPDPDIPFPFMRDICSSCPNLKKLTLTKWFGTNKDMSKIWGNLPLLEEVKFEACEDLGNRAFVGRDKRNPCVLEAKNLRSLSLQQLDKMPGITDTLFNLVLRRMPLKELYIGTWGDEPLDSISIGGITSLLIGTFSQTIEKLSLNVKLDGVTGEEMAALKKKFRSSDMI